MAFAPQLGVFGRWLPPLPAPERGKQVVIVSNWGTYAAASWGQRGIGMPEAGIRAPGTLEPTALLRLHQPDDVPQDGVQIVVLGAEHGGDSGGFERRLVLGGNDAADKNLHIR